MATSSTTDSDVLIIGGGPAGLSAAIVLGRACHRVALFDSSEYRNAVSQGVHGFLSRDGILPSELRRLGREQLAPYDVRLVDLRVEGVDKLPGGGFRVRLEDGSSMTGRRLLLATGMVDHLPDVPGFMEVYGRSAHHCPFCDGWDWRGKRMAVYAPDDGAKYAGTLCAWSEDVTLLTDGRKAPRGEAMDTFLALGGKVRTEPLASIVSSGGHVEAVRFQAGAPLPCETFFFHLGMEQSSDLPEALGCRYDANGFVRVGEDGQTTVPGIYAAGDLTPGPQSVALAAAEGSMAAAFMHQDLWRERSAALRARAGRGSARGARK